MFSASKSASVSNAYALSKSLRFRSSASAYLSRTPSSAGNRKTFTVSYWVKRGTLGVAQYLFSAGSGTTESTWFTVGTFDNNGTSYDSTTLSTWTSSGGQSVAIYRDPSAWYHFVWAVDTTQATASNRVKLWVNNVQQTLSTIGITQNADLAWNNSGVVNYIGARIDAGPRQFFDGYLTEIYNIDGQALTPSSFGATDATTGQWVPANYTGTYGTNGFHLPFNITSNSTYYGAFNGSSQYLSFTAPSGFNCTGDFTLEGWSYLTAITATGGGNPRVIMFGGILGLQVVNEATNNTYRLDINNTTVITSPNNSAVLNVWQHWAVVRSGSTITLYINGVSKGTATNSSTITNAGAGLISAYTGGISSFTSGNLSNFRFVVGTAVYTSNFVPPTSPLTAISGTQFLTLQNATIIDNSSNAISITNNGSVTTSTSTSVFAGPTIAADTSGNSNNWTPNNISLTAGSTYDSMNDVPTLTSATVANYCVLNPNDLTTNSTLTNGNLSVSISGSTGASQAGTLALTSGKWYWEVSATATTNNSFGLGILRANVQANIIYYSTNPSGVYYNSGGNNLYVDGSSVAYGATWSSTGVTYLIGIALDLTANTITFYINNSSQGAYTLPSNTYGWRPQVAWGSSSGTGVANFNFGQQPFTYTPPSGYLALNTYNLSAPTIAQGNKYMDATTYTGTGATLAITNAGAFQPDFIWAKERSATRTNCLTDSVRGFTKYLYSDSTGAEETYSTLVTSANSNGFSVGTSVAVNDSGQTYVGWQWKASNATAVSNTSGSITSSVSANTTAGFSVVTYTNASSGTVGHGLGVAPAMVIYKDRTNVTNWIVIHQSLTNMSTYYLRLNTTDAVASGIALGGSPTSSVIYTNTNIIQNGAASVAYCFAQVAGFSAFGSYIGNKSTTGPFVYLGFRPKFIMFKNSSIGGDWNMLDTSRSPYNQMNSALQANGNYAEASNSNYTMNYYSNGFQIGTINDELNSSGGIIIYMAFAENPFKYANAR
jgi:hypothetical protein